MRTLARGKYLYPPTSSVRSLCAMISPRHTAFMTTDLEMALRPLDRSEVGPAGRDGNPAAAPAAAMGDGRPGRLA
jgi:hypothetical protein